MYLPKPAHLLIILLFMTAITLPLLSGVWFSAGETSLKEKRKLAALPEFNLEKNTLERFPRQFDAYFNDHFGFRGQLIHGYNKLNLLFHTSPSAKVLMGRNDWLFFRGDSVIDDFANTRLFNSRELETWREALERKRDRLASERINYLFVVAPNKHTVYAEMLPAGIEKVGNTSRLDQLLSHLEKHSDLEILDLRAVLAETKGKYQRIYHRTDTHWNHIGASVATKAIVETLRTRFPQDELRIAADPEFRWKSFPGGDLAVMLGLEQELREDKPVPVWRGGPCRKRITPDLGDINIKTKRPPDAFKCAQASRRMLTIHDSFGNALIPHLAENFSESLFLRPKPSTSPDKLQQLLRHYKPDLVLEIKVERSLGHLPGPGDVL